MKKVLLLIAIVGTFFTGCDPMEDTYYELGDVDSGVEGNAEYTLTEDDYAALVEQGEEEDPDFYEMFNAFSDMDDAKEVIPPFLSDKYPFWGKGSSVLVNFNLYDGNPENVSNLVNAADYILSPDEYPTVGGSAFLLSETPNDYIPDVLANQATPEEGDITKVEYKQFTEEPETGLAPIIEYNFAGSFEDWASVDLEGDQVWTSQGSYVEGNGYSGGAVANIDWLVSPEIDLSNESNVTFQISQAINYAGDLSLLKIYVSTGYTGDVETTTWDEITLATSPAGDSDDFILSEDYDFSVYDGETINIAFKYESTDSDAARWRVESIALKTQGISGSTLTKNDYYVYNGSEWELMEGVYYLTSEDYDSMGEASGQPGQYDNFSETAPAENYISTFLSFKNLYSEDGDQELIMYKYYGGSEVGTITKGNLYTYDGANDEWFMNMTSLQFGLDAEDVWVPDNTIKYSLTSADYAYVVENYADEPGFESAVANLDSYGNFNIAGGPASWSDENLLIVITDLLANVIASPSAEEGQKYEVTFATYGASSELTLKFIKQEGEWVEQSEE